MTDNFIKFEFIECDNEASTSRRQQRRQIREQSDSFIEFDETEFLRRYRLSKQLVLDLCEELRPLFKQPVKSTDLSIEKKILTALSFYATESSTRHIGDIKAHSMAQHTVSSVILIADVAQMQIIWNLSDVESGSINPNNETLQQGLTMRSKLINCLWQVND